MTDLSTDKKIEQARYNESAKRGTPSVLQRGSAVISKALAAPYFAYEEAISEFISEGDEVLELGAGQGEQSLAILEQGAKLTALDISDASLKSLRLSAPHYAAQLRTLVGDMEAPDIADASIDRVVSAGAMSYANKQRLISSIDRILRPGGLFIAVDSWNHNPIYRFNRWRHFRNGARTGMTLQNMPDARTIRLLQQNFDVKIRYFGCLSFLVPLFHKCLSGEQINRFLALTDRILPGRYLAFKILIIAQKK